MSRSLLVAQGVAVLSVVAALLLKLGVDELTGPGPSIIFFVPAVTFSAWVGGLGPGLTATALSSAICVTFLMSPIGDFWVSSPNDVARLAAFGLEGLMTSVLMGQLHSARRRSEEDRRISEQFREQLSESEGRLQAIMDNSTAIIYLKDVQGRFLLANRQFGSVVGLDTATIRGRTDFDLFPREAAEGLWAKDREVLASGRATEFQEVIPLADGEHAYVALKFPLLDGRGTPYAVGGILTDITALKEAQHRALEAERLAAIGEMMAGLAHESRNALQRGQACLEMLARRVRDRPETLTLVADIQQSQDDLHRLYEEVRNYSAPILLEWSTFTLAEIVREAWGRLGPARQGREACLRESGPTSATCRGDRFRLIQVFRNIFENALAAGRDPVVIEVCCTNGELGGLAAIRVAVKDNGPGLTAEQRERLFEPFFTTKTQGTGLGMAIARRIVEAHGGQIQVGPESGPGACIEIVLPGGLP